ncbi:MAG TPA: L-lactate permease [Candidatus Acidoferrales bacterium]|jgi:lactate permease|nr:L-lactate permease [Candidatus Acidoferrales bacterium]
MFQQILTPTGSMWSTILLALVPLAALLFMLAVLRMTAWLATIIAGAITILIAIYGWHAPAGGSLRSYFYGGLQGAWTIDWITFWGLIIFNTLVLTGDFDRFKTWMINQATVDVRIQTLMLAWAFGALLEGLVGFGYPWAVVVPILVGLGIVDLEAIRVAALANNAPVSYGALGSPVLALAAVTGLPLLSLSASIGDMVAILALLPPFVLIYLVSGWDGLVEAWPLAIVGSLSYIVGQWPVAHYLGPYLPDLSGALVSFWVLLLFVKVWKPKNIRAFGGKIISEQQARAEAAAQSMGDESRSVSVSGQNRTQDTGSAFRAWLPYIILIVVVVLWTGPWSHLPGKFSHKWSEHAISSVTQKPMASTFNFNPLSGGTSILASWLVIILFLRPSGEVLKKVFARTFKQMWGALLVAFFIFAVAYLFVYAGIANSLAFGFSKVGWPFVILAPILGWIGVALSGSNTSTNAMFGPIQAVAGKLLGLPVLLGPTLNSLGAEVGKPIAPQTASVGVSTSRFVRSEGEVIRHNMAWTLIVLGYLILIGLLFYFVFPGAMTIK